MSKFLRTVLESLKTNKDVKALGFSRKELKGIAANVADKLQLKDDATDDEVSEAVSDAIDDVLPLLKLTQSAVDRQVQDFKNSQPSPEDEDEDDDKDEPMGHKSPSKQKKEKQAKGDEQSPALDELKSLFKESFDKLTSRMDAIEKGNKKDNRRAKVEKLLKDTGKFGERQLKAFSRMTFENDEEFDDYLDELKSDLEDENQERANKGLEKLGNPPAPSRKLPKDDEVMSDDEIKALAKS